MKLAIFDIDGTLVRTKGAAHGIFVGTYEKLYGITGLSTDWHTYRHATDSGMAYEILEKHFGRAPVSAELDRVRTHFTTQLRDEWERNRIAPPAVEGAGVLLAALRARGWQTAIATGNWRESGLYKLRVAGIEAAHLPGGYAEDAHGRGDIIRAAIERAKTQHRQAAFDKVVYAGDAVWDVQAAEQTGVALLGVGGNGRDERLQRAGARHMVSHYKDIEAVIAALETCQCPTFRHPDL